MGADLMAVKIEVDPFFGLPPHAAAQQIDIKGAGFLYIIDGKGEMKRMHFLILSRLYSAAAMRRMLVEPEVPKGMPAVMTRGAPVGAAKVLARATAVCTTSRHPVKRGGLVAA